MELVAPATGYSVFDSSCRRSLARGEKCAAAAPKRDRLNRNRLISGSPPGLADGA